MNFRLAVLIVLSSMFFGLDVQAADWWFVAWDQKGEGDSMAYIDKSRIERIRRGSTVTAWVLTVFREDQKGEFGAYRSEKDHLVVDCENQKAGWDHRFLYSAYGGLVKELTQTEPHMDPIAPDTLQASIAAFICSEGKQSGLAIPVYDPNKDAEQRFWLRAKQLKP